MYNEGILFTTLKTSHMEITKLFLSPYFLLLLIVIVILVIKLLNGSEHPLRTLGFCILGLLQIIIFCGFFMGILLENDTNGYGVNYDLNWNIPIERFMTICIYLFCAELMIMFLGFIHAWYKSIRKA